MRPRGRRILDGTEFIAAVIAAVQDRLTPVKAEETPSRAANVRDYPVMLRTRCVCLAKIMSFVLLNPFCAY
jgi:hypothetical protein